MTDVQVYTWINMDKGLVTNYREGGGHVKFYPYEKGGGGEKSFSHAEGGAQKVLGCLTW